MTFQITNDTFQKHYNSYFKLAPNNLLKDNLYLCFTAFLNQRKKNEQQNISSDVLCKHFDVIYSYVMIMTKMNVERKIFLIHLELNDLNRRKNYC